MLSLLQNPYVSRPSPRSNPRLRLFCFPYAGGGASVYARWAKAYPETVEICPVQLPGRENRLRDPLISNFDELMPPLMEALRPYLDCPFAVFGHSMGGIIAYEWIRQLRRHYLRQPVHMFVSASRPPFAQSPLQKLYTLPDEELLVELQRMESMPQQVLENQDFVAMLLPAVRSDFKLLASYKYIAEPPFDVPITAFYGVQDRVVYRDEVTKWADCTTRQFKLETVPGGHFFVRSCPELLAQHILAAVSNLIRTQRAGSVLGKHPVKE